MYRKLIPSFSISPQHSDLLKNTNTTTSDNSASSSGQPNINEGASSVLSSLLSQVPLPTTGMSVIPSLQPSPSPKTITKTILPSPQPVLASIDAIILNNSSIDPNQNQRQNAFTSSTGIIYLQVKVLNVNADTVVNVTLAYDSTHDQIGPVQSSFKSLDSTRKYANFQFTKPTKGWPLGSYTVTVAVSGMSERQVHFTVTQ